MLVIVLFCRRLFLRGQSPGEAELKLSCTVQASLYKTHPCLPLCGFPVGVRATLDALQHAKVILDNRRRHQHLAIPTAFTVTVLTEFEVFDLQL
jgi:hypothetical protein